MHGDELEIEPETVESLLSDTGMPTEIVDVREDWELARGVLPGAVHMPLSRFQEHASRFSPDKRYVIYCEHGVRSLHVAEWLSVNRKVHAKSMRGGFADWRGPIAHYEGGSR